MNDPTKPLKKIEKDSPEWLRLLKEAVVVSRPRLVKCISCGRPTEYGFKCMHCKCEFIGFDMINVDDYNWEVSVKNTKG